MQTDATQVVDATDRLRADDCAAELHKLLEEEVGRRSDRGGKADGGSV
jgi:hypothetical protein